MASPGVTREDIVRLYESGKSIPQVSEATGKSRSTVRYHLLKRGIIRTRAEGVRRAAKEGRVGSGTCGIKRVFSAQWKKNLSESLRKRADETAVGLSLKPSGYIEVTRGKHKGRGQHRVVAEESIGRRLRSGEIVHHIDGNRSNNDPSNLEVMTHAEHCRLHAVENCVNRERDKRGRFM